MPEERIVCVYADNTASTAQHFHNTHELLYVKEGRIRIRIGKAEYEVGAHSLIFISRLEEHDVTVLDTPYCRWWMRITAEQLAAAVDEPRLRAVFDRRPEDFCHVFDLSAAAAETEHILQQIADEDIAPRSFKRHRIAALLQLLLITCYRLKREQFPLPVHRVSETVLRVQAYLDTHFNEDVSLEALARDFYLSPSYLSHAFRDWTGYSPKQYLVLCRLSYARELLLTTDQSVAQVATRCGFGDVNNFIRSFREHIGCTPAVYRRTAEQSLYES